ncbi:MAG: helix-turn-helix domain-containing protein [Neisseriaceae bacterium]|nr:helix-turn-helix domain-containing protein [Neisseriaceae bacterium]
MVCRATPDSCVGNAHTWQNQITATYFPLTVALAQPQRFQGQLRSWPLGELTLSYLTSDAAAYQRDVEHIRQADADAAFLITLPVEAGAYYQQLRRHTMCRRQDFVLQLSYEPYCFDYRQANALWVLKIPHAVMRRYLRHPERYGALGFNGQTGLGALFGQYVQSIGAQYLAQNQALIDPQLLSRQLLELFAQVANKDERILQSSESSVRNAHLRRIEDYVAQRLDQTDLSPAGVAQACQISTRYLHDLFKDTGGTFNRWLLQQRLEKVHDVLSHQAVAQPLALLAYQWGFADPSHFSRAFKKHYGYSPRDIRQQAVDAF